MKSLILCIAMLFATSTLASERYSYETALSLYNQQNYTTAFIHLRNVLHEQPENLPAKLLLSSVLYQQGLFYEAGYLYEEALAAGADINLVLTELLSSYQISNQQDAIIQLGQYTDMTEAHRFDWLLSVFFVHIQRQDNVAAQQALTKAAQLASAEKHLLLNAKATLALAQANLTEAANWVEASLELNADYPATWRLKGDIVQQRQSYKEALSAYQQAFNLAPADPVNMRSLSAAFIATGDIASASELMNNMQNLGLNDTYIRFAQAFITSLKQDGGPAAADLKSLHADLTALPASYFALQPDQLFVRASAGYLLGNIEQALRDFEHYLQLIPHDTEALLIAAEIYRTSRERSQTLRFLEQHQPRVLLSPQLMALQVKTVFELERLQQAEKLVTQARSQYPQYEPLLLLDAQIRARLYGVDYARQLLQQSPNADSPAILLRQALLALDMQELQLAAQYAKQLIKLEPSADNLNLLAGILLKSGQLPLAQQQLDQLFALAPQHFSGQLTQANIYFQQQHFSKAATLLTALLTTQPRHLQTSTLLAAVELAQNQTSEAEKRLNELLNSQHYKPAVVLLTEHYVSNNKYDVALAIVQRALRREFMAADLLLRQASIQMKMGDKQQAMESIRLLESLPDISNDSLHGVAKLHIAMQELTLAESSLQVLMNKAPETLLYQLDYIQVLLQRENFTSARQSIDKLKVRFPHSADVLVLDGEYHLLATNNTMQAFELFEHSVRQDMNFRRAWANLYELARQSQFRERFTTFANAQLHLNPVNSWLQRLLAEHYMNHEMYAEAKSLYLTLLAGDAFPNDAQLLNNVAMTMLTNEPEQAAEYAKKAIAITPNHTGRLTTYAKTLIANKQFELALPTLRQAYSLNSANKEVLFLTALCLLELQRKSEATALLQQLIAQSDSKIFADKAAELLSSL